LGAESAAARPGPAAARSAKPGRWRALLWLPFVIALALLVLPQALFIWMSFHKSVGMGRVADFLTIENYRRVLTDPFYLRAMWLTFYLSLGATLINLALALPTAYYLARLRSRWVSYFVILLLVSLFVTVVIKVLALSLVLGKEGLVNDFLRFLRIVDQPVQMLNSQLGVLIGLVQYTLPLLVMLMIGVIQTIPASLEEAAEIHGATWLSSLRRVVLPLAWPGVIAGSLIVFNMNMGAFTSAVLLGGGRVLTFPVLIQRKVMLDVGYAVGATLSTVLLLFVLAVNLASIALLRRERGGEAGGVEAFRAS